MDGGDAVAEPDDSEEDDGDTLDLARDGVGDGGDDGEEGKGDQALHEVKGAVKDEFEREPAMVVGACLVVGEVDGGVLEKVRDELEAFGPEPKWGCEDEGETG